MRRAVAFGEAAVSDTATGLQEAIDELPGTAYDFHGIGGDAEAALIGDLLYVGI
jgi:hypothetical protein